jgi:hypothetical protein
MKTVGAKVLLGWMEEAPAVAFLMNDCVFDSPIDEAEAKRIWLEHRLRIEKLPMRPAALAKNLGFTIAELGHIGAFRTHLASLGGTNIIDVAKVEIFSLAVMQYVVVTDRANSYATANTDATKWLHELLPARVPNSPYMWAQQFNIFQAEAIFDVPHAEFYFFGDTTTNAFSAREAQRHVTISTNGQRTYLMAGYHRIFARVLATPTATVPTATVAVALWNLPNPVMPPNPPKVTTPAVDTFDPFGTKPALYCDFFTDGLFMDVRLKKKRYQLQVSAKMVALDDN